MGRNREAREDAERIPHMNFRPCIDIHGGKVKQIVGGSLNECGAATNFVSEKDAAWYASFYREKNLPGGHVILLDPDVSPDHEKTKAQACGALRAWPGALMAGGGITPENAAEYLDAGASHVIVTSYVFRDGRIDRDRIDRMLRAVGKERLVLDLSCRRRPEESRQASGEQKDNSYYVVTDRWQTFTKEVVNEALLTELSSICDQFLVHAVDVEGKSAGIEEALLPVLARGARIPVTYAGGIASQNDVRTIKERGAGRVDFTIGSALDLFGGQMALDDVLALCDP